MASINWTWDPPGSQANLEAYVFEWGVSSYANRTEIDPSSLGDPNEPTYQTGGHSDGETITARVRCKSISGDLSGWAYGSLEVGGFAPSIGYAILYDDVGGLSEVSNDLPIFPAPLLPVGGTIKTPLGANLPDPLFYTP